MTGFALVLGLSHEPPVKAVTRALERMGLAHVVVDQRRLLAGDCRTWFGEQGAGGVIDLGATQLALEEVTGVYARLTTWADLPDVAADPRLLDHARRLHEAIDAWLESTAARVVNRTSANDTNHSKPYQSLLMRDHFDIPATLVTNDPEAAESFRAEFGRIIYKSVSGERSIVSEFTEDDRNRLGLLANAPVQFQEHIDGVDVRVHVVGSEVFATRVDSNATDYRYDVSGAMRMHAVELADAEAAACVALTSRLGLQLSGIDLRYTYNGRVVCFEVNPSPAYIVYEDVTRQPIAAAIARRISGA